MHEFIQLIQSRSGKYEIAFARIHDLLGSMMSILRQKLDSLIGVLYLLSLSDLEERNRFIISVMPNLKSKTTTMVVINFEEQYSV